MDPRAVGVVVVVARDWRTHACACACVCAIAGACVGSFTAAADTEIEELRRPATVLEPFAAGGEGGGDGAGRLLLPGRELLLVAFELTVLTIIAAEKDLREEIPLQIENNSGFWQQVCKSFFLGLLLNFQVSVSNDKVP